MAGMHEEARGFPAARWGLTFGIVLVITGVFPIVWLATNGYHIPLDDSHARYLFNQLGANIAYFLLAALAIQFLSYFLAGFFTARDTGTVPSGALAAVIAYIAASVASYLVSSVVLKLSASTLIQALSAASALSKVAFAFEYVLGAICGLTIGALITAGFGALGALLGCAIFGRASYS